MSRLILASVACMVGVSPAQADTLFHAIEVPPVYLYIAFPEAMNNHGVVARMESNGQANYGYLWGPDIEFAISPVSGFTCINDDGQVGGVVGLGDGISGYAAIWDWRTGQETYIGDLPGGYLNAHVVALNNRNEAVCFGSIVGSQLAFYWSERTGIVQYHPVTTSHSAVDINDLGVSLGSGGGNGYLWPDPYTRLTIPKPASDGPFAVRYLNNHNEVLCQLGLLELAVWSRGAGYREVPVPGDSVLVKPYGFNDAGWVVGDAWKLEDGDVFSVGFLSHPSGALYEFPDESYLDKSSQGPYPIGFYKARHINNRGQIVVGSQWDGKVAILTPVLLGDMNCDERIDLADLPEFLDRLHGVPPQDFYCGWWNGDMNQDGLLTHDDLPGLLALITQ